MVSSQPHQQTAAVSAASRKTDDTVISEIQGHNHDLLIPRYPPNQSYFVVDLENTVGREYAPVIEDIFRMICIQFTIQLMLYFNSSAEGVFTWDLLCVVSYVVLGVILYWLVFKSVVTFR